MKPRYLKCRGFIFPWPSFAGPQRMKKIQEAVNNGKVLRTHLRPT